VPPLSVVLGQGEGEGRQQLVSGTMHSSRNSQVCGLAHESLSAFPSPLYSGERSSSGNCDTAAQSFLKLFCHPPLTLPSPPSTGERGSFLLHAHPGRRRSTACPGLRDRRPSGWPDQGKSLGRPQSLVQFVPVPGFTRSKTPPHPRPSPPPGGEGRSARSTLPGLRFPPHASRCPLLYPAPTKTPPENRTSNAMKLSMAPPWS
jgi:hypothetical protein